MEFGGSSSLYLLGYKHYTSLVFTIYIYIYIYLRVFLRLLTLCWCSQGWGIMRKKTYAVMLLFD